MQRQESLVVGEDLLFALESIRFASSPPQTSAAHGSGRGRPALTKERDLDSGELSTLQRKSNEEDPDDNFGDGDGDLAVSESLSAGLTTGGLSNVLNHNSTVNSDAIDACPVIISKTLIDVKGDVAQYLTVDD